MENVTTLDKQYPSPVISSFFESRAPELLPLLCISVILGFFVDYVVITQSKQLGKFKYYVLNQTVWAQLLEAFMILLNPVFLSPYFAGYMGGIFRNVAGYTVTFVTCGICFILFINVIHAIQLSLLNRFILTFRPEWLSIIESKRFLYGFVGWLCLCHLAVCTILFIGSSNELQTRIIADEETFGALRPFYNESTLIYGRELNGLSRACSTVVVFTFFLLSLTLLGSVAWFISNVLTARKSVAVISTMTRSLLVSSLIQAFLCVLFLYIPIMCMTGAWAFNIHNSANVVNGFVMLMSMHGTVDMLSTLYFVVPYRKFCRRLVFKDARRTPPKSAFMPPVIVQTHHHIHGAPPPPPLSTTLNSSMNDSSLIGHLADFSVIRQTCLGIGFTDMDPESFEAVLKALPADINLNNITEARLYELCMDNGISLPRFPVNSVDFRVNYPKIADYYLGNKGKCNFHTIELTKTQAHLTKPLLKPFLNPHRCTEHVSINGFPLDMAQLFAFIVDICVKRRYLKVIPPKMRVALPISHEYTRAELHSLLCTASDGVVQYSDDHLTSNHCIHLELGMYEDIDLDLGLIHAVIDVEVEAVS
uniref:G protein-coupled receptor n=1 Tax=Panagrellus redivivus TaxID=6233 RepID=A0A7E4ZU10_PANRE